MNFNHQRPPCFLLKILLHDRRIHIWGLICLQKNQRFIGIGLYKWDGCKYCQKDLIIVMFTIWVDCNHQANDVLCCCKDDMILPRLLRWLSFFCIVFPEWRDIGVHWCLHCLQVYLYDLSVYKKDWGGGGQLSYSVTWCGQDIVVEEVLYQHLGHCSVIHKLSCGNS